MELNLIFKLHFIGLLLTCGFIEIIHDKTVQVRITHLREICMGIIDVHPTLREIIFGIAITHIVDKCLDAKMILFIQSNGPYGNRNVVPSRCRDFVFPVRDSNISPRRRILKGLDRCLKGLSTSIFDNTVLIIGFFHDIIGLKGFFQFLPHLHHGEGASVSRMRMYYCEYNYGMHCVEF